jgi:hypothetical protein
MAMSLFENQDRVGLAITRSGNRPGIPEREADNRSESATDRVAQDINR